MKQNSFSIFISVLISTLFSFSAYAVDLVGHWKGSLEVGQQSVPIIFKVTNQDSQYFATMDSPMQNAIDIPVKSVEVDTNKVVFTIAVAAARYEAKVSEGTMQGTWKQSGQTFPLTMKKEMTVSNSKKTKKATGAY